MNINSKIKLNNGVEIPALGYGTYKVERGREALDGTLWALEAGYRHIDTASMYGNESDIGDAVRKSGIPREEIFITTKVWNSDQGYDRTLRAFDASLSRLNSGYIDLYLIHWPVEILRDETYRALETIYSEGRARAIGVSNYTIRHLEVLISKFDIVPAVNQVEFSPFLYQKDLLDYCNSKGILIEAYSPLVRGRKMNDPRLRKLAEKYGKDPAQMLIKWGLQHNLVSLPKSSRKDRIISNADVFGFEISPEDMELMNSFNENFRIAWDPSGIK
jgi:diketogulonate reductase-like aldo/keto reductase